MDLIPRVRRFNRTYTRRIGALDADYLGRKRPLGASRMLFEIGAGGANLRELRARLGLDSGYVSRLLRSLERERLVRVAPDPHDARARRLTLTPAGRKELTLLERLSDEIAESMLSPLSEKDRHALVDAMDTLERLLRAGSVLIDVEDPTTVDAQMCIGNYFAELAERFESGFDPVRSISADAEDLVPPHGYLVLARLDGEAVGCGALKCHRKFGEIKRMWVAPAARGLGVGRRILERLESLAHARGLRLLRLETNRTLIEAQALYRSAGYVEVPAFNDEPYAHHWFVKRLPRTRTD